uniref:VIgL family C1q-related protein 2 n=1 Tax=Littorina littorea TaxID=31216 RepID=A0A411DEN2_LITLI|nr:VIgL family C1q-related protein 2 [Littorina littorea]
MSTISSNTLLFGFLMLFSVSVCFDWSPSAPPNFHVMYACAGSDVELPWNFTLTDEDQLKCVEWFVTRNGSTQMIAAFSHEQFLPTSDFSGRAEFLANGGLLLRHVTKSDAGKYSVEVNGSNEFYDDSIYDYTTSVIDSTRSLTLEVSDDLLTADGDLRVTKNPSAVLDKATDRWRVELLFGSFGYNEPPQFDVEWTTPDGIVYDTSLYEDKQFHFLIPNPVATGNYTCRISPKTADKACLHDNSSFREEKTLFVDGLEARVTLLEARSSAPGVAFYARDTRSVRSGAPIVFSSVSSNLGSGYNSNTGVFIAPTDGVYFFAGSARTGRSWMPVMIYITVNGARKSSYGVAQPDDYYVTASVEVTVDLKRGNSVSLRCQIDKTYSYPSTASFTGFLVSRN